MEDWRSSSFWPASIPALTALCSSTINCSQLAAAREAVAGQHTPYLELLRRAQHHGLVAGVGVHEVVVRPVVVEPPASCLLHWKGESSGVHFATLVISMMVAFCGRVTLTVCSEKRRF